MIVITGAILFGYALLRAATVSFSWDENYTTMHFVLPGILYPLDFDQMTANHHLLNVWGMWCSAQLFGYSELALRIPALVGHLLYLGSSGWMALRSRNGLMAWAVFLILNAHPYLIDFFSLARGYGLANGAELLSLAFLLALVRRRRPVHAVLSVFFAVLAAYANLMSVQFLLALLLVMTWSLIRTPQGRRTLLLCWAAAVLGAFGLLPFVMGSIKAGAFYYGADAFWSGTIPALAERTAYDGPHFLPPMFTFAMFLIWAAVLVILVAWGGRRTIWSERSPSASMVLFLGTLSAVMLLQHLVLGTRWPLYRTSLFLLPPFLALVAVHVEAPGPLLKWRWRSAYLVAFALTIHLFANANVTHCLEWSHSGQARELFSMIGKEGRQALPKGRVVNVAADDELAGVFPYYRMRLGLQHIHVIKREPGEGFEVAEHYLVDRYGDELVDTVNWDVVLRKEATAVTWFRDKRSGGLKGDVVARYSASDDLFDSDGFQGIALLRWSVDSPVPAPLLLIGSGAVVHMDGPNWTTFLLRVRKRDGRVLERMVGSKDQVSGSCERESVAVVMRLDERLEEGDEVQFLCLPYVREPVQHVRDRHLTVVN